MKPSKDFYMALFRAIEDEDIKISSIVSEIIDCLTLVNNKIYNLSSKSSPDINRYIYVCELQDKLDIALNDSIQNLK